MERFAGDTTLLMTVFHTGNNIKKRTIIKSIQKLREQFSSLVSDDKELGDLILSLENAANQ
jgi:hypothetical protein